ncbi:unnamed protein product [Polarella glacialis]|uniref:Uncharacterized protein n=1 Tax=Polarella glacialis TaxID=89957 RepID=A0A813GGG9_POLGL|nr:unnamed protein product [Polarella glacialis]
MVDIVNKKCQCGRCRPYFGLPGDERPSCCVQCKSPDMVDIVSKKCKCGRCIPVFGLPDDERPTCCVQCKSPDMVDIVSPRCAVCGISAHYPDSEGSLNRLCAQHSADVGAHTLSRPTHQLFLAGASTC